jgi:hypothetical protein
MVDVVAQILGGLRQALQRVDGHARHQVGQEGNAEQERQHGQQFAVGRRRRRAWRQHRQLQYLAVVQLHVHGFAGAAPLVGREDVAALARQVAGRRVLGQRAELVALAQALLQRSGEIGRRQRCRDRHVGSFQTHRATAGGGQIGRARAVRHDVGGGDQLLGPFQRVEVAVALQRARAFADGQPLGQRRRSDDAQQQHQEHTPGHRTEESFHACGSTVTWPAST